MGIEPFRDRLDAGARLARRLTDLRGPGLLITAIPRGGVPVARAIADALGADLDVVTAALPQTDGNRPDPFERGLAEKARRRRFRWTGREVALDVTDRVVVVVDDGLAAVPTFLAALREIRARGARRVVAAVPVASPTALGLVASEADDVRVLAAPPAFESVRQYYRAYPPVSDEEVAEALRRAPRVVRAAPPILVGSGSL